MDHRNAGLWRPPGGYVEPNEHPRATVVWEIEEELGIETSVNDVGSPLFITVTETVGNSALHSDVSLWYLVFVNRHVPISSGTSEFYAVNWFMVDDIPFERAEAHLHRFIAKFETIYNYFRTAK